MTRVHSNVVPDNYFVEVVSDDCGTRLFLTCGGLAAGSISVDREELRQALLDPEERLAAKLDALSDGAAVVGTRDIFELWVKHSGSWYLSSSGHADWSSERLAERAQQYAEFFVLERGEDLL